MLEPSNAVSIDDRGARRASAVVSDDHTATLLIGVVGLIHYHTACQATNGTFNGTHAAKAGDRRLTSKGKMLSSLATG